MVRPEVVEYLRQNLPKHRAAALRRQLGEDGVSDADFEDSLAEALRGPRTRPPLKKVPRGPGTAAKILLMGCLVLVLGAAVFVLAERFAPAPAAGVSPSEGLVESGYVGSEGWVVRLPKGYEGVPKNEEGRQGDEVVYFCPHGTDPTNFIDKGLYGEIGIVRLEVDESQFPASLVGASELSDAVARKTADRGETYVMKKIQIGTLPGVQIDVQSPFPRVEAYVLGGQNVYFFYGGQDDDLWRSIVLSLRDANTEE